MFTGIHSFYVNSKGNIYLCSHICSATALQLQTEKKYIFAGTCPDPSPENGYIASIGSSPVNGRFQAGTSVQVERNHFLKIKVTYGNIYLKLIFTFFKKC